MRISYRAQALGDIEDIHRYLEKRSPTGAANVLHAIHAAVRSIAEQPYASPKTSDPQIRTKVVHRYSYRIFCGIIDHDSVEIIHVRHTSRRPWIVE